MVEDIEIATVDEVLPSGTVVNFALIDVEKMEIGCLEGMKETLRRSPDLIIMCEWAGAGTSADYPKRRRNLL